MRFSLSTAIFPLAVLAAAVPKPVAKSNGIAIKLTKHAPFPNPHNTVDVDVLKAHVASFKAKVLRGLDNYEKNMGRTHPYAGIGNGIRERGAGVPLTRDQQQVWLGEISIGTPPKTLTVEIGTGASDLFVLSTHCGTCAGDTLWDPDGSSTSRFRTVVNGKPKEFNVNYSDPGSLLAGILYVDNVTISGFTADEQTFGAASTYLDPSQDGSQWDPRYGMLGLAFQSISAFPIASKPLLATLVHDEVTEPVFSVMLASDEGELYIGGVNPDLYRGEFTYTYVTVVGYWQVEIQSIQDDKGKLAKLRSKYRTNVPAAIDTGCNFIIGDPKRVSTIHTALGGIPVGTEGFYAFPCDSFPGISFSFGGRSFEISPALLNLGRISPGSNKCFSAIIAASGDLDTTPFWIIGNTFLQSYYTTFEFGDNPRVGFAELQ